MTKARSKKKTKPAPPAGNKPKRGRGRPPKVPHVAPAAKATTPAQDSVEVSTAEAMAAQLKALKAKAATGKSLANHEQRVLRDAWLQDMAQYLWEGAPAAAADLNISVGTFRGYREKGCPGIEDHSPIPKHTVLAWLYRTAHDRGGERGTTNDDIEAVELQIKQIKAAKAGDALKSEAEDRATQGVIRLMGQIRNFLQNGLPSVVYEIALKHPTDRTAGEDAISQAIETELRRFDPATKPTTPTTERGAQSQEPTP